MRKLLVSTTALSTALSVAISPMGTMPAFAQVLNEDGSVTGKDGAVLCVPTAEAPCDLDAIIEKLKLDEAMAAETAAAAAEAAAAEAEAKAAAEAQAAAEAEAAAAAQAQADAEAQAAAEAAAAEAAAQAAAAQAEAEAKAAAEAQAAAEAEAAAAAQAQADAEAQAAAEAAAAEAAAQAAADQAAAEQAAAEAAAAEQAAAEQAAAEAAAAAQAEAEAAAKAEAPAVEEPAAQEPAVEEPAAEQPAAEQPAVEEPAVEAPVEQAPAAETPAETAVVEDPAVETPAVEVPEGAIINQATGEAVDPEAAAAAVAAAEAELVAPSGEVVDPAAGLKVAAPDPGVEVVPVDAPEVTESEVESLTQLLTADPTAIDPATLGAAELVKSAPTPEGTAPILEADPGALVAAVTETITDQNARASSEEFAAAPTALSGGKKSGLSDLEKAGLLVLGALAVGAIIKNNRAAAADTTVSTMGPQEARVVSNTGDRVIVLQPDGTYRVLKDDDAVIRRPGSTVRTETFKDGSTRTIVERADGTQVVTIRDATGRVLRRATYDSLGREVVLIDDLAREDVVVVRDLPKPRKRIVISSKDQDVALKRELARLEADRAGRKFSLRQIREIPAVRALAATLDVTPITFASGSAAVAPEQARNLADLGRLMQDLLAENPREIFLIEGHTDATGKAAMNLALSDRRAESVALALTEYFDIPPENMVVQGYGETELLIDTQASEPRNRRVEVRLITPLLRTATIR
ncbi:OmpA family protein [Tabrizicola thermarum]|uniref:OmpA family protein n=1 Tax=Tabrizicola thermarum TaxID=2670345 RepID=UPI000FFC58AD|nr:OmpA family protein [Tabrizicola thermarum]